MRREIFLSALLAGYEAGSTEARRSGRDTTPAEDARIQSGADHARNHINIIYSSFLRRVSSLGCGRGRAEAAPLTSTIQIPAIVCDDLTPEPGSGA